MRTYLNLVKKILDDGEIRGDRTGNGTISIFGAQERYDLREGFPVVTTKKLNFDSVVKELLWFLRGSTNIKDLGCGIWDAWADSDGELGPIYGKQWRDWGGTDQILQAVDQIKHNPQSRRIVVSAWNVTDIPSMALPPCHTLFQLYVSSGRWLDLQLYQRSADMALGVPFNIASYSLLLSMLALECALVPRYFIHTIGDAHIYLNHIAGLREQLSREPLPLPTLELTGESFDPLCYDMDDICLLQYRHHPAIRFPVAV